jgi:hypothetical protein
LRGAEALIRVADHAARLREPAAGATLESYGGEVLAPVNMELRRLGAAVPTIEARNLGDPNLYGLMDFSRNVIVLNEGAVIDGGRPFYDLTTPVGRQNVLSLVFHEARHAEQMFHALRHRARVDPDAAQTPVIHGNAIDPAIVEAANRAGPPRRGSAESEMARRAYDEFFGADHPAYQEGQDQNRREQIRDDIQRLQNDRARIVQQTHGLYSRPAAKPQRDQFNKLQRDIDALNAELTRLDDVYWRLYVEVDARGAQENLLRELEPARQNALRQRVQDAGDLLEQIRANAPDHENAALANLVAAMRNYQREMERLRQSLPKPPAPAPTGGGSGTKQ